MGMSYIKPEQFFKMYSGQAIDDIQGWLATLGLSRDGVDWIGWRLLPTYGRSLLNLRALQGLEVRIIAVNGQMYSTQLPVNSQITYLGEGDQEEES